MRDIHLEIQAQIATRSQRVGIALKREIVTLKLARGGVMALGGVGLLDLGG